MSSGNVDNPEGGLDALIQVAVCEKVGNYVKKHLQLNAESLMINVHFLL